MAGMSSAELGALQAVRSELLELQNGQEAGHLAILDDAHL